MLVRILHWLPACAYATLIFFVSHQPRLPDVVEAPDYLAHFVEYAFFGLTLAWGVTSGFRRNFTLAGAAAAASLAALYALTDEFHQSFIPNRHASLGDVAADVLGAIACLGIIYFLVSGRSKSGGSDTAPRL